MWRMIKLALPEDSIRFVEFVKKGEEEILFQFINPDFWESRFGGFLGDFLKGEFWPPHSRRYISTESAVVDQNSNRHITKKDILTDKLHMFWVLDRQDDSKIFLYENDPSQQVINEDLYKQRLMEHDMIYKFDMKSSSSKISSIKDLSALMPSCVMSEKSKKSSNGVNSGKCYAGNLKGDIVSVGSQG